MVSGGKAVKSFVIRSNLLSACMHILLSITLKNFKFDFSNKKFSKAFLGIHRDLVYGTWTSLDFDSCGRSDNRYSGIAQAGFCHNSNRPCCTRTT
jgi:hypothetical protein